MDHRKSLEGRVALVTGSSTGLGKDIALRLAREGAKVVMNYANNAARAEKAFAELQAIGGECILCQASAVEPADIATMMEEVRQKLGEVEILVVNATPDQPQKPIEEYDWAFYQQMLDFFVKSPFLLARAVLPSMKKMRWGRIINIGSEVFQTCLGNFSAYVAAKGAQVGWTHSMATELAPHGITVNLVAPGWIPTERHVNDPQAAKDAYLATIPMRRWGSGADVADAVAYFAGDGAAFVSGQTICVNGAKTPW